VGKENDDVNETTKIMRQKGIRRLPVVDDNGALVGIVTLDDLIDLIAEQLKGIAALIGKQQNVEKRYR
jgi:CBS domain-containing protein